MCYVRSPPHREPAAPCIASEICPGPRKAIPWIEAGEPHAFAASSANPVCPSAQLPLHRQRRVRPVFLDSPFLREPRVSEVDLLLTFCMWTN